MVASLDDALSTPAPESPEPDALDPRHSTRGEDGLTLAFGTWLIGGLFLDGYAHTYIIDTATEDFFTLWHAVFYAGFAALAAWIGVVAFRRRRPGSLWAWVPPAYRPAVVGLAVFAVGGVGDAIWHTVFGVEVGIDALLSPTHLILFVGALLALWTPVRASDARGDTGPWLAVGTVALITSILVFFVQYLWVLPYPWWVDQGYDPNTGFGTEEVQTVLGATMVISALLVGPLLVLARRWTLPFGVATLVWTAAAVLESLAFSNRLGGIVACFLGGVAFDVVLGIGRGRSWALAAAATGGPAVVFAVFMIHAAVRDLLAWPPELWGGTVVVAAFVGLGATVVHGSARTPATDHARLTS